MARIRKGMWVLHDGGVAIVAELGELVCELHHVDGQGLTAGIARDVPLAAVAQAALANIPEPRRPDEATARRLGYL